MAKSVGKSSSSAARAPAAESAAKASPAAKSTSKASAAAKSEAKTPAAAAKTANKSQPHVRYMPPGPMLEKLIRRQQVAKGRETVSMSIHTFHKLLELALGDLFDEKAYLEKFSDIQAGVKKGTIPSALRHFVTDGYFENRIALKYDVDEDWYLKTYPDVAHAIKTGKVKNGAHHFEVFGYAEGRVPNKDFQKTVGDWHDLQKYYSMQSGR